MDKHDALFSLLKIALQVDPSRITSVSDEFKTILSAILKEEPAKELGGKKEPDMSEFMQQNITEQFMGRSPSLIIHPVPCEQPRYVPQVEPKKSSFLDSTATLPEISRIDPFSFAAFKYSFADPSEEDVHSLSSIESIKDDCIPFGSKRINDEVLVVKAPTEIFVAKVDDDDIELNAEDNLDAADEADAEEEEEEEEEEDAFEEFPLKDGIHYKDIVTNIVYKEREAITRVGVFNPDTGKFKRDIK